MTRFLWLALVAVVGGSFALAIGTPAQAGKPIQSIAADFDFFGFEASTTSQPPLAGLPVVSDVNSAGDGLRIYQKTYPLSAKSNVITIEMFTTGDTHGGATSCFTCIFTDPTGARGFCNPGGQGAGRCAELFPGFEVPVPGWVALNNMPTGAVCSDGGGGGGDCHDNNISYKWCYGLPLDADGKIIAGLYTTELWMATANLPTPINPDVRVFIEQAHFYINETKVLTTDNSCTQAPDLGGGEPGDDGAL